jgi:restriction endonuclease S subunit
MKSLDDYKRSVIWHVVTGKYEVMPDLTLRKRRVEEMKESKTEWIGRIPKEWETARLKDVAEITNGSTPPTTDISLWEPEERDWFTPVDLTEWPAELEESKRRVSEKGANTLRCADAGAILMSGRAPVGLLGITTKPCVFNQGCKAITSKERCLAMILFVAVDYIKTLANATTFEEISSGKTGSIAIPRIPEEEGRWIEQFLKKFTSSLPDPSALISAREEFKKSLIWHIVTGKYEVLDNGKLRKRGAEEMKTSNCSYLPLIPKDWELRRFKDDCEYISGVNIEKDQLNTNETGTQFLRTNDIWEESSIEKGKLHFDGNTNGYPTIKETDYIICCDGFSNEPGKGTIGVWRHGLKGIIGPHIKKIVTKNEWAAIAHGVQTTTEQLCVHARGSIALSAGHHLQEIRFTQPKSNAEKEKITCWLKKRDLL